MKKLMYFLTIPSLIASSYLSATDDRAEDIQTLNCNINDFAVDYYKESVSNNNYCFSPYSIFSCLGMVYMAAESDTDLEMKKAMRLSLDKTQFPAALNSLRLQLAPSLEKGSYKLTIADALWVNENISLLPAYKNSIEEGWNAKIESLSFSDSYKSASIINQWVSAATKREISQLISPNDLSSDTALVLTNAIYFKGFWEQAFQEKNTRKMPFYEECGYARLVNMMKQAAFFPYFENEDLQMLLLPIKGEGQAKYASFFILPKGPIKNLEEDLTGDYIKKMVSLTKRARVLVKLPRFEMKVRSNPEPALSAMGMNVPFSLKADFSGITKSPGLKIDKIVHEAVFKVYENGVTAAAATGVAVGCTSMPSIPFNPIIFNANHPFLFGIIDLNSGLMLFLGKLTSPIGKEDALQY